MRVAALDLGTNTFLLLIAETRGAQIERVLHDEARVVRLGQGVDQTGQLSSAALGRAEAFFSNAEQLIRHHQVERVVAVATSAARDASNSHALIAIGAQFGIPIEVISGAREAELSFLGSVAPGFAGESLLIDIGGGSTEILSGALGRTLRRQSLDIGAVRLTERYVKSDPPSAEELSQLRSCTDRAFGALGEQYARAAFDQILAVAGTATSLLALSLGRPLRETDEGRQLSADDISHQVKLLSALTNEERRQLPGLDPGRADVIIAGAMILESFCSSFALPSVKITTRGVRYGVLFAALQ